MARPQPGRPASLLEPWELPTPALLPTSGEATLPGPDLLRQLETPRSRAPTAHGQKPGSSRGQRSARLEGAAGVGRGGGLAACARLELHSSRFCILLRRFPLL